MPSFLSLKFGRYELCPKILEKDNVDLYGLHAIFWGIFALIGMYILKLGSSLIYHYLILKH